MVGVRPMEVPKPAVPSANHPATIASALRNLAPQEGHLLPQVEIADLRKESGLSKEEFEKAARALVKSGGATFVERGGPMHSGRESVQGDIPGQEFVALELTGSAKNEDGPADHPAKVASAFQKLAKGSDPISLADLHKASGLSLADFHAGVQALRKAGVLSGSRKDRDVTPAEQAAAIKDGDDRVHLVSVRDPKVLAKLLASK